MKKTLIDTTSLQHDVPSNYGAWLRKLGSKDRQNFDMLWITGCRNYHVDYQVWSDNSSRYTGPIPNLPPLRFNQVFFLTWRP